MAPESGPDRGWSWVVAFACCFASLILAGIFRTSGVLFVAFINEYGVSREAASWPMVLCISVLNLTGPFSGILARKIGGRPVIITGAVIAALGISSCCFTFSLDVITFLFGGVFGVGYGFMNTIMPGILNAYFLNFRATANGIANAGSCIGSIILPIAFEHFIYSYGLSGCFLLTGGIVLHITIAGALMRPLPWMESKRRNHTNSLDPEKHLSKHKSHLLMKNNPPQVSQEIAEMRDPSSPELLAFKSNTISSSTSECNGKISSTDNKETFAPCEEKNCGGDNKIDATQNCQIDPEKGSSSIKEFDNVSLERRVKECENRESKDLDPLRDEFVKRTPEEKLGAPNLFPAKIFSNVIEPFKTVLTCPMFFVTGITNVSFYFLYHMYVVIIVDYALDEGVPENSTKYILFAFSIADLFGRLCLGWVTDKRFISRTRFVMGCMMLIGVVFFLFPFAKGYWPLIFVSCCYGLLLGCTMVVFPILLVDFLGLELHSVSYGCMCFMNGFASFGRPFLIGYFRDSVGSYSNMFYVLGTISVVASMLWLLEGLFIKKHQSSEISA